MLLSPALLAIILGITVALSFAGGFTVSNWHDSGKMAALSSSNAVLKVANDSCAEDISTAHAAYATLENVAAERTENVAREVKAVEPKAQVHVNRSKTILALPSVPINMQCEAIRLEQLEYLKTRRTE